MATGRRVDTNFWKDTYVVDLDPSEKYIFLYMLTNPRTTIAGVYEISLREIAFDTGYDVDMVKKILERFERDGKIIYRHGWLVLFNWQKHQLKNPNVEAGMKRVMAELPDWLKELITEHKKGQVMLGLDDGK